MSTLSRRIPLSIPHIAGNEWAYVKECLDTGWVSSAGAFVSRFEAAVAAYVGASHGVATVNGTASIHVALHVVGVRADDEVLVSDLTFIAPANAVRYLGAWPVLMDADPAYWQMDAEKVLDFLTLECRWQKGQLVNKATGRRIAAIMPVHILGHPVDIDPILQVAQRYEIPVVEDATESLGASYKERMAGHLGHIGCFSFNGNKIITTGGGGMLVTDNGAWAEKARYLTTQAKDDPEEYVHHQIGFNYRLTNIQAAIGVAQLEQLPAFIEAKRRCARAYEGYLSGIPGITPHPAAPWADPTYWLYTVLIDEAQAHISARHLRSQLGKMAIETRCLWTPLHRQRPYRDCQAYRIEATDRLHATALHLPSSVNLLDDDVRRVAERVRSLVGQSTAGTSTRTS